MVGTTLGDIRDHIEALASERGEYYLVCARYGDRPVPADGLSFESRSTARAAARATEQYRTALRRYDPRLPYYDVIVCQGTTTTSADSAANEPDEQRRDPEVPTPESGRQSLIDFCHTVAGAIFETVAASDHSAVEQAIMGTYLAQAETIDTPDELCLRMLESMATELDQRLTSEEQAQLLVSAAARLPESATNDDPLDATLSHVCSVALATDYTVSPCSIDLDTTDRSWTVTLSGYALDRTEDEFTTLPLVIDLLRRRADPDLTISHVTHSADASTPSTWRFRLTATPDTDPRGLVRISEVSTP
jgi:hypothetical protein